MTFSLDCIDCQDIIKQNCLEQIEIGMRYKGANMGSNGGNCYHAFCVDSQTTVDGRMMSAGAPQSNSTFAGYHM